MNYHSEFDDLVGPDVGIGADAADAARSRLRTAIRSEVSARRRAGFVFRSAAMGVVIFLIWAIAPSSPSEDQMPLLGLAAATAQRAAGAPANVLWYSKANTLERVDLLNEGDGFSVMKHSVREQWTGPGAASGYERLTVADLSFPSDEDATLFAAFDGELGFEEGAVEVESFDPTERWIDPMWAGGPAAIERRLAMLAGHSDDLRLDRVRMLEAATDLMREFGADPARQSLLLYTIAGFPGIEVERDDGMVQVVYRYVYDAVAREMRLEFDAGTGLLVRESVSTMPYGNHPAVLLSDTQYEWAAPGDDHYLPPSGFGPPVPGGREGSANRLDDFGQEEM